MKIARVSIENFMGITAAEIIPKNGKVELVGANAAGKTSVLEAVKAALKGWTDVGKIHGNATKGKIIIELEDGMTIERSLTRKGSKGLKVEKEGIDGVKVPSSKPQRILDQFFGPGTFNPLEVLDPAKRETFILEMLNLRMTRKELFNFIGGFHHSEKDIPFDIDFDRPIFAVVDELHKNFYAVRRDRNRDAKVKRTLADEAKAEVKDVDPLVSDPASVEQELGAIASRAERARHLESVIIARKESIKRLAEGIQRMETELEGARHDQDNAKEALAKNKEEMKEYSGDMEREKVLLGQRAAAKENEIRRLNGEKAHELSKAANEAEVAAIHIDELVGTFSPILKSKIVRAADVPIDALEYDAEGGTWRWMGRDVNNLSSSEAIRFAVKLYKALNPDGGVVCIDGAEVMDGEVYDALEDELKGSGIMPFVTTRDGERRTQDEAGVFHVDEGKVTG